MVKIILRSCFIMASSLYLVDASADSFEFQSEINSRIGYDDNILFTKNGSESSSVTTVTPKITLIHTNDNWESRLNASVAGTTYSAALQNQVHSHVDIETTRKDNLNAYSIMVGYDIRSNRALDSDILGLTPEQVDTETVVIAPKYTHTLTERLSMSLAYSNKNVEYVSTSASGFVPYETQAFSGSLGYKLSKRSRVNLLLQKMDYAADDESSEYEILTSQVGVEYDFSRLILAKASLGISQRDFTNISTQNFDFFGSTITGSQVIETNSSGTVFDASLSAGWISAGVTRSNNSNSNGGLNQIDKISAKLRMQYSRLIALTLSFDREDIDELSGSILDESRVNTTITPAIKLSLSRNLSVRAVYVRTSQEYEFSVRGKQIGNKFYVSMKYNFPSI